MLAIVCFWVMFALAITKVEATDTRHIYIFRALSVLRTSRLLLVTSGTAVSDAKAIRVTAFDPISPFICSRQTIMHSLKRAGPLLIRVAIFAVFALVLFSIIGEQSFSGSFRRTCLLTGEFCLRFLSGAALSNFSDSQTRTTLPTSSRSAISAAAGSMARTSP
jgi:voltage-dependent calcium channel